jgi:hypothetical protein
VPPKWILEPKETEVTEGSPVVIPCQADGFPAPTLSWKKAMGRWSFVLNVTLCNIPFSEIDRNAISLILPLYLRTPSFSLNYGKLTPLFFFHSDFLLFPPQTYICSRISFFVFLIIKWDFLHDSNIKQIIDEGWESSSNGRKRSSSK